MKEDAGQHGNGYSQPVTVSHRLKRAQLLAERYDPLIELTVVDEKKHRTVISVRHLMVPTTPGHGRNPGLRILILVRSVRERPRVAWFHPRAWPQ